MSQSPKPKAERIEARLPAEMAQAFNLMAHPLAGMAAMSAIGLGMASHAMGIWVGAMSGAVAASRQLAPKVSEALEPVVVRLDGASPLPQPTPRAKADVLTLISDARAAAERRALEARNEADAAAANVARKAVTIAPEAPAAKAPAVSSPSPVVARPTKAAPSTRTRAKAEPRAETVAEAVVVPAPVQPKVAQKADRTDDLKLISGIGPKLEQVLNGLGISTYAQVVALTAGEIAAIEDRLGFKGRIGRDDWVGQANALAARKAEA